MLSDSLHGKKEVSMKSDEAYIPLILRSKFLRENWKYFFLILAIVYIFVILLGIIANYVDSMLKDPRVYFELLGIIYTFFAAKFIIERFIKVFNIDLYNSRIVTEKSKEFLKIEKVFGKETTNYQKEILNSICNKNEKRFILLAVLFFISSAFIYNVCFENFGIIYNSVEVYPWTFIANLTKAYLFWIIFMGLLLFSLVWILIGMLRAFKLMSKFYELKFTTEKEDEKIGYTLGSLKNFKSNIKPIIDLMYLTSSLTIIFAFIYTIAVVCDYALYPSSKPYLYFLNILVLCGGLVISIWPQITLHGVLENAKETILFDYYSLYENKRNNYLNILKGSNEDFKAKEDIRSDLSFINELINQIEKFNTWPFFSRMYKLIGVSLGSVIIILVQILSNKFM